MFGLLKKIEKKKQLRLLEEQARNRQEYQKKEELYKEARGILRDRMREEAKNYMKWHNPHIAVGDRVILNKYEIDYKNRNGWDSGVNAILSCLQNIKSPIYAKITDIYVTHSLANERIDGFIDNQSDADLRRMIDNNGQWNGLWSKFRDAMEERSKNGYSGIFQKHTGLYIEAAFELEFIDPSIVRYGDSFKPSWGLNIGSFLKDDSPSGIKTKELWMEEISINFALQEVNKRKKELEERLNNLWRSY